jgi:hypothetical protein
MELTVGYWMEKDVREWKDGNLRTVLTFLNDGQVKTAGQALTEDLQLSAEV